jgi:hypothetical protein
VTSSENTEGVVKGISNWLRLAATREVCWSERTAHLRTKLASGTNEKKSDDNMLTISFGCHFHPPQVCVVDRRRRVGVTPTKVLRRALRLSRTRCQLCNYPVCVFMSGGLPGRGGSAQARSLARRRRRRGNSDGAEREVTMAGE